MEILEQRRVGKDDFPPVRRFPDDPGDEDALTLPSPAMLLDRAERGGEIVGNRLEADDRLLLLNHRPTPTESRFRPLRKSSSA